MNYSKEELTEYNGERGYWRTINGKRIFISIEDTKEEREQKIKNFVERKRSNNVFNNVDETNESRMKDAIDKMTPEQIRKLIQQNIENADAEFDKKLNEAREKYKNLRDKLQNENLSQEEKNEIQERMNDLTFAYGKKKQDTNIPREKQVREPEKKILQEKTEKYEDVSRRTEMTDPYAKFGLEKDEEFLKERNFNNENDKEKFYRAKEIEHNINYLKVRGIVVKGDKLFNERTGEYLDEKKTNEIKLNARKRTKEIIEKEMSDYDRIKASLNSGEYKNRLKGSIQKYYERKGKKYKDDSMIKNAEYLADKYLDEETRKLKRWTK